MNDSRLREALQALVTKLDKVTEDTKGLFAMAWAHGQMYQGANYGEELKAAKAALAEPASDLRAKLESLRDELNELANYLPHEQSEDPDQGMIPTQECGHCQILCTIVPKLTVILDGIPSDGASNSLQRKIEALRDRVANGIISGEMRETNKDYDSGATDVEIAVEAALTAILDGKG